MHRLPSMAMPDSGDVDRKMERINEEMAVEWQAEYDKDLAEVGNAIFTLAAPEAPKRPGGGPGAVGGGGGSGASRPTTPAPDVAATLAVFDGEEGVGYEVASLSSISDREPERPFRVVVSAGDAVLPEPVAVEGEDPAAAAPLANSAPELSLIHI